MTPDPVTSDVGRDRGHERRSSTPGLPRPAPTGPPCIILASTSPRRHQLLAKLGVPFDTTSPAVEELTAASGLEPAALAEANASRKAAAVSMTTAAGGLIIGADTVVAIDGDCLGKPADLAEAAAMLRRLSGRTHRVITGVALHDAGQGTEVVFHEVTAVTFHELDDDTIARYLAVIDPLDKAGGYAAQDHGEVIIRQLDGPLDNVVGLPLAALKTRLRALGVELNRA